MLGSGRPFVLEIKEPQIRSIDLEELENRVNQHAEGKVEVLNLKFVGKNRRSEIKTSSTDTYKVYRALVQTEEDVTEEDLESLKSLDVIKQRTPIRVSHRRADKIRTRHVKNLEFESLGSNLFELTIHCEGGLYIKELISGDEDRTKPSVSQILGTPALCTKLDVMEVNI
jgi:tRNA pseudouridine synthase 10